LRVSEAEVTKLDRQVTGLQWWAYGATGVAAILAVVLVIN
jgi:hypothetical protein